MRRVVIYYRTNDIGIIRRIQNRFRLPHHFTVNGEWPAWVADSDWEKLKEVEAAGYIQIRNKNLKTMKPTDGMIEIIAAYLNGEAQKDAAFAAKMEEQPEKTPERACEYILHCVSKDRRNGYADAEIFGMAKHFIDEADIKAKGWFNNVRRLATNEPEQAAELAEEDRAAAIARVEAEHRTKLMHEDSERRIKAKAAEEKKKAAAIARAKAAHEGERSLFGDLFD